MQITSFPIHAVDDAALQSAASAWARAIQERLRAAYGQRFDAKWTYVRTHNHWSSGPTVQGYDQEIALSENGRACANIVLTARAQLPRALECGLLHIDRRFTAGSKSMRWFSWLAMALAFCGWAYYMFVGDGWARTLNRFTHLGACADCARKIEVVYAILVGWWFVPIVAAAPFYLLGEAIDSAMNKLQYRLAWRKLNKELLPSLKQIMRDIEVQAKTDQQVALTLGIATITHLPTGTPHAQHSNVVWNGSGGLLPVEGYAWAGDAGGFEVKLKPDSGQ